jgi:hypothetical protein
MQPVSGRKTGENVSGDRVERVRGQLLGQEHVWLYFNDPQKAPGTTSAPRI